MSSPHDDDLNNMTGAFALDALSAEERSAVEAHLGESEAMQKEVAEMRETASLLGRAVTPVAPSAALKLNLMALVASTPQLPGALASVSMLPREKSLSSTTSERKAQSRWFRRPVTTLAAAAASVALVIGGVAVANTIIDADAKLAQTNQLVAINASNDFQQASVDVTGGGHAKLVWSVELGRSALLMDGLALLPSDETYQLWYINAAGARSAGTFAAAGNGSTWRVLDGTLAKGDTVGVTVEPRGGSTAPTTDPIIIVKST